MSDAGLKIATHFYNSKWHDESDNGVPLGKVLNAEQKKCMTWDLEREARH